MNKEPGPGNKRERTANHANEARLRGALFPVLGSLPPVGLRVLALSVWLAGAVPAPGAVKAFETFIPQWKPGMEWTVEARYRINQEGMPGLDRRRSFVWSEPLKWKYRVMERTHDRNLEIIRVRAEQIAGPGHDVAGFFFLGERTSSGALKTLSLARAAFRAASRGGDLQSIDYTTMSTGPFPVINELSSVPADFPIFELGEPVRAACLTTRYVVTEADSRIYFARDVQQLVKPEQLQVKDDRIRVTLPKQAPVLQYLVERSTDQHAFRELWTPSRPWFLYAENGIMKAWLVDSLSGPHD